MAYLTGTIGYIEGRFLVALSSYLLLEIARRLWSISRVVVFELYSMAEGVFSSSGPAVGAGWTSGGFGGAVLGAYA